MDYRRLGRAGMKVSALGLGTWLTFEHDQAQADELVDAAIEVGINFFDTANTDGRGRGEERLGRALARHRREPLVIATKVWGPMGEGPNQAGLSRKHLVTQCEASLRRLGIDHLDLYQCQRYDPETTLEETLRALDDLIRAGKVLYWGVSGWGPADLDNACRLCEAHNLHRPISYQVRYNLLEPGPLAEILPTCRRHGLGVVAYSPLAQGVLSGKYLTATPADSRLADERAGRNARQRYGHLTASAPVTRLATEAAAQSLTPAQLALREVLATDGLTTTIMGARTAAQVKENVAGVGLVG